MLMGGSRCVFWRMLLAVSLLVPNALGAATPPPTSPISRPVAALPPFLPYSLGAAVEVRGSASDGTALPVQITLSVAEMPTDPQSQALVHIFYYDDSIARWQRLPTRRSFDGEAWQLTADGPSPGIYAAAISTETDYGDYQQPWQPTVTSAQVDLFTGVVRWSYPIDVPTGRGGLTPQLALTYNSGIVDALQGNVNPQTPGVGMGWTLDVGYIITTSSRGMGAQARRVASACPTGKGWRGESI